VQGKRGGGGERGQGKCGDTSRWFAGPAGEARAQDREDGSKTTARYLGSGGWDGARRRERAGARLLHPQAGGGERWRLDRPRREGGQAGRWRATRLRSKAAGGHFISGAAEGPGGPPRPQTSAFSPSPPPRGRSPPRPEPEPEPGRGSAAEAGGPAWAGGHRVKAGAGAASGASRRRDPGRGWGGRGQGEEDSGEPLPILGRSRRRRRPAVGESKVVAGRHFGIFPQPAGHCGGHRESGPMAGGETRSGRDTERG
jgi:hypothetical protein